MKTFKLLAFVIISFISLYIVNINVNNNFEKPNHIKISDKEIDNDKKHIIEKEEEVKNNDSKPNTNVIPNIKENNNNRNDNNANNNKTNKEPSKNNANDIVVNKSNSVNDDTSKVTKPKEEPKEEPKKEIIEKGPWDTLGITKYQYENEPIQQGSEIDFKTYQECADYGNTHEPFINGKGGYNCNEVTSWTKSLGWDYVPFYD